MLNFRWDIIGEYLPFFLKGALLTIGLSVGAIFLGLIFGLLMGIFRISPYLLVRTPFIWT